MNILEERPQIEKGDVDRTQPLFSIAEKSNEKDTSQTPDVNGIWKELMKAHKDLVALREPVDALIAELTRISDQIGSYAYMKEQVDILSLRLGTSSYSENRPSLLTVPSPGWKKDAWEGFHFRPATPSLESSTSQLETSMVSDVMKQRRLAVEKKKLEAARVSKSSKLNASFVKKVSLSSTANF